MPVEAAVAKLPKELEPVREKFLAMIKGDPAAWPEGEKVEDADSVRTIANNLIPLFHSRIRSKSFAYLFVEKMGDGDRIKLGSAAAANAKVRHIANVDFILTFNWTAWRELSLEQKVALVDHELCHCDVDLDSGRPVMLKHDIEEFGAIVSRHAANFSNVRGARPSALWRKSPRKMTSFAPARAMARSRRCTFSLVVQKAFQTDLFQ